MKSTIAIYTQDTAFDRKATAYLQSVARILHLENTRELDSALDRDSEIVLLFDLQGDRSTDLLPKISKEWPETVMIAVGEPRSAPARMALAAGALSIEDVDSGEHLQHAASNALSILNLKQENRLLKEENFKFSHLAQADSGEKARKRTITPSKAFLRPFREFSTLDSLLKRIVEELAGSTHVSRTGIFIADQSSGVYRFKAGVRCSEEVRDLLYPPESAFARWIEHNSHMVARQTIEHVGDHAERLMLSHLLNELGAEAVIPLHARDHTLGWIFIGPHTTGLPFELHELEEFSTIAEQISTTLENASLYEEIGLRKTLAETLLNSIPSGIIAAEVDGSIRLINKSAGNILGLGAEDVVGQPAEKLGPRIADVLYRALDREEILKAEEWMCPSSRRRITLESRCLENDKGCVGALAIIKDATPPRMLKQREDQIERDAFWANLASAMSHEIHNPLVTIKTFAQLMPERYADPEFRNEFSAQMLKEVEHLSRIVEQINQFANPPQLTFRPLDVKKIIQMSVEEAAAKHSRHPVKVSMDKVEMPSVKGDAAMLTKCFGHMIQNSIENRARDRDLELKIRLKHVEEKPERVRIDLEDNGRGIGPEIIGHVFSPFCTTKARGMGLGLPVTQRIITDHNGSMDVKSNGKGAIVGISLPIDAGNPLAMDASDLDSQVNPNADTDT